MAEQLPQCQATTHTDTYTALRVLVQCERVTDHPGTHQFTVLWADEPVDPDPPEIVMPGA